GGKRTIFGDRQKCRDGVLRRIRSAQQLARQLNAGNASGAEPLPRLRDRPWQVHQNIATGLTGDPVPPTTTSGRTISMNSYRPSSAHAFASGSSNALSTNPTPYAKMTPCTDQA